VLRVESRPDPAEVCCLEEKLHAETLATAHADEEAELAVFVRDDGATVGGVYGWTWGGCCELQVLWVEPARRGQGLGSALLRAAELEASRRGCTQVVLFTHDSQAPGLYEARGYELVARVDGYPADGAALWFRKPLV
jgi:ribosomal protein S18 acetylase RimI-like enzyme